MDCRGPGDKDVNSRMYEWNAYPSKLDVGYPGLQDPAEGYA